MLFNFYVSEPWSDAPGGRVISLQVSAPDIKDDAWEVKIISDTQEDIPAAARGLLKPRYQNQALTPLREEGKSVISNLYILPASEDEQGQLLSGKSMKVSSTT
jgi:hypothetical protein